jgi:outer membrane protein assembly factor BamA
MSRDGVGAGFDFRHSDLLGEGEQLRLKAVFTTNGDHAVAVRYAEKLARLDGRELAGRADYEVDHNERTFGVGGRSRPSDLRLLQVTRASAGADFELGGPITDLAAFGSDVALTYASEELRSGVGAESPVVASGDSVAPPPAFGERVDYASATWTFRHDLRDSSGRTGRGTLLELDLSATSDLEGRDLSAARATLRAAVYVPVAPRHRTLALSGGVSAVTAWSESSRVPYHALVKLGRSDHLRGYVKGRFADVLGAWSSAEYRYPIFEFKDTGVGLSSTLFVDAGMVAGRIREFADNPLRLAYGFGVRAETAYGFIFRAQIGLSAEGVEALFSLNDTL